MENGLLRHLEQSEEPILERSEGSRGTRTRSFGLRPQDDSALFGKKCGIDFQFLFSITIFYFLTTNFLTIRKNEN